MDPVSKAKLKKQRHAWKVPFKLAVNVMLALKSISIKEIMTDSEKDSVMSTW